MIFDSIKSNFAIVGANSLQSNGQNPFNLKNVMIILIINVQATLCGIFVFYEANSFREYVESVFAFSTVIVIHIVFPVFIWKIPKMFELMNNIEKIVNKSK